MEIIRDISMSAISTLCDNEIKVNIRWMVRRDMSEVLTIEKSCFEYAWSEEEFMRCLRQRNCIGMVAEYKGRVVGFMIYELPKTKIHLLNVAVLPEFRRLGVGIQMIAKLIGKLSNQRRNRITLEVRETNLAAQLFFRSLGFRATEILRDFYDEMCEDAYLMVYKAQEPTLPPPHFQRFNRCFKHINVVKE
ncbi:MAG: ribosomal protein S18-alanine N-acetyltransferase [Thermoguttaceae bacterium]